MFRDFSRRSLPVFLLLLAASACFAQELGQRPTTPPAAEAAKAPNSDATYRALRTLGMGNEAVSVSNLVLKRDAGTFTFATGTFCLAAPVNGKVTAATFTGSGAFELKPPLGIEQSMLSLLTKGQPFKEEFSELTLRFTDATYAELKKAGTASTGACGAGQLQQSQDDFRKHLHRNISARVLEDVLSPEPGGLFLAMIKGKHYNDKMVYVIDPHGAEYAEGRMVPPTSPEEVALYTWDDMKSGVWSAFHLTPEYQSGQAMGSQRNRLIRIEHQKLDTQIERNGKLTGDALTTLVAQYNGVTVVPFDLFPTLRVTSVSDEQGHALGWVQEDKDDDPDFAVILAKPLAKGDRLTIRTQYSGKDAVIGTGEGNYFPVARTDWYPNTSFGDYATYELTFRVPKVVTMVASGTLLKEVVEGNERITTWKSEVPQAVAGFNLGQFKRMDAEVKDANYQIQSFANENPPDFVNALKAAAGGALPGSQAAPVTLGNLNTVSLMGKPMAEAQIAVSLYNDYFGPAPYKHVAVTQQTACNYGQAWPTVVYLPICAFFDTTQQHQLGLDDPRGYWKAVAAHEVSHQWWGHTVGFGSYRDQWMSEGFAQFSTSLFIQKVYGNKEFQKFWNDERDLMTERNAQGWRGIDAGPVTMGYRLSNTKTGAVTARLIYPKGGYILHMIRMMMWEPQKGDAAFKEAMRDFVQTYQNKVATTEDFKAAMERHLTPYMNAANDGRMDWFFDQYVYGTELPHYKFDYSFDSSPQGPVLKFTLQQSGVREAFRMPVPIYLELSDGRVTKLGVLLMVGNTSQAQTVALGALKSAPMPKRAMINYYDDVLAVEGK